MFLQWNVPPAKQGSHHLQMAFWDGDHDGMFLQQNKVLIICKWRFGTGTMMAWYEWW
jgi:hypothetical protein